MKIPLSGLSNKILLDDINLIHDIYGRLSMLENSQPTLNVYFFYLFYLFSFTWLWIILVNKFFHNRNWIFRGDRVSGWIGRTVAKIFFPLILACFPVCWACWDISLCFSFFPPSKARAVKIFQFARKIQEIWKPVKWSICYKTSKTVSFSNWSREKEEKENEKDY